MIGVVREPLANICKCAGLIVFYTVLGTVIGFLIMFTKDLLSGRIGIQGSALDTLALWYNEEIGLFWTW